MSSINRGIIAIMVPKAHVRISMDGPRFRTMQFRNGSISGTHYTLGHRNGDIEMLNRR